MSRSQKQIIKTNYSRVCEGLISKVLLRKPLAQEVHKSSAVRSWESRLGKGSLYLCPICCFLSLRLHYSIFCKDTQFSDQASRGPLYTSFSTALLTFPSLILFMQIKTHYVCMGLWETQIILHPDHTGSTRAGITLYKTYLSANIHVDACSGA